MRGKDSLWVLGHRVRTWATDDSYGLIEIVTAPGTPGPPPHFHRTEHEFFLVLSGALEVMVDGAWSHHGAGSFLELPPGTVHTFENRTETDAVWITGWRPKGFERFFAAFGVPADGPDARAHSVSDDIVSRVMAECERFGMYIKAP